MIQRILQTRIACPTPPILILDPDSQPGMISGYVNASLQAIRNNSFAVEGRIVAEADILEARTIDDLTNARRRFLSSIDQTYVEDDLPPVLLSEG